MGPGEKVAQTASTCFVAQERRYLLGLSSPSRMAVMMILDCPFFSALDTRLPANI
jgi:poly(3-hydroxybutyrate) depolymerase